MIFIQKLNILFINKIRFLWRCEMSSQEDFIKWCRENKKFIRKPTEIHVLENGEYVKKCVEAEVLEVDCDLIDEYERSINKKFPHETFVEING